MLNRSTYHYSAKGLTNVNLCFFYIVSLDFYISGVRELTDSDLLNLSKNLTSRERIRSLAINGLNMNKEKVDAYFTDYPNNIKEAAYRVLDEWSKSQVNKTEARTLLIGALYTVNLPALAEHLK